MNNKNMTVPRDWVEHYAERLEECCGYEQAEIVRAFLAEPEGKSLDDRLKAAGMFSVAQMLAGAPLDRLMAHADVRDLATFARWVEMTRAEFLRQLGRYELGETVKGDLYEWVVAHTAVLGEVHVNLKAALAGSPEPVELAGVAAQLKNGFWDSCSGCHETEDGHPVGKYPYSQLFGCALGAGCGECGGIGAVWDSTDYDEVAKAAVLNGESNE
ncbi:hypothetical protein [Pseudomonas sp. MWU12-2323]|uniref:hypothetical protein n=1 Tax=Pseudomonas sp. MWU12-2323 TaxID=2651296 RepID=UPI00128CB9E7|nr:hypothetical protein [Pseudomonas sp. MWU12-2323]MPQ71457.1 hypothetical protein [Pseudomonas sp. MWU12-2323]